MINQMESTSVCTVILTASSFCDARNIVQIMYVLGIYQGLCNRVDGKSV